MTAAPKLPGEPLTARVSDNELARIVARTDAMEWDATAFERIALDLRECREELRRAESINAELNRIAAASRDNASNLSIELEQRKAVRDAAQAEVAKLREALSKYGFHGPVCIPGVRCFCGLDDFLSAPPIGSTPTEAGTLSPGEA